MPHERITIDPRIHHGQPVIKGSRVPVALVVGSLGAGMSAAEIEKEYGVDAEDIRAALTFAADMLQQQKYYPLSA